MSMSQTKQVRLLITRLLWPDNLWHLYLAGRFACMQIVLRLAQHQKTLPLFLMLQR